MYWAVKIEMNVPLSWRPFLIKEMQDRVSAARFVKAATRIFVICQERREILSGSERRLNDRPGGKTDTYAALTVNIIYFPDNVPKAFRQ